MVFEGGVVSKKWSPAVGTHFRFNLGKTAQFETGVDYIIRKYSITQPLSNAPTATGDETLSVLHFPALLNFQLTNALKLGLGGYYEFGLAAVHDNFSPTAGRSSTSWSWAQAGYSQTNYGLEAALSFEVPISRRTNLLLGGRYWYGLTNIDKTGGTLIFRNAAIMIGWAFQISKTPRAPTFGEGWAN